MTNDLDLQKHRILQINIRQFLMCGYALFIVFMPASIKSMTCIYSINANEYINAEYAWLSYSFSALELIPVVYALIKRPGRGRFDFRIIIITVFVINIFRAIIGMTSIFTYMDFSLILSAFSGYGCYLMIVNSSDNYDPEVFLDLIILFNFFSQILYVFTGNQMEYGGRYAALGSSVGQVGTMCCIYVVYFLFTRKRSKLSFLTFVTCIISLILSGSRTNLILTVVFSFVFLFRLKKGLSLSKRKKRAIMVLLVGCAVLIPLSSWFNISGVGSTSTVVNRMINTLSSLGKSGSVSISADSSYLARIESIVAGWNIIKHNLLGIGCSAIDLQLNSLNCGYLYFPHSTLMCHYLLWGLPALYIIYRIIKLLILSIKKKNNNIWVLIILLIVMFAIYGAPTLNPKVYLWYFLVFGFCYESLHVDNNNQIID